MEGHLERPGLHLDLCVNSHHDKTFIAHQYSRHPFHICKPLYVDTLPTGMATIYLQSSAGGIFSGDHLKARIQANPYSQVHLTSQASTVVHRMSDSSAEIALSARVGEGALFEYLPDPLILFPESNLTSRLKLELDDSSTAILSDAFLMYDPYHQGEYFTRFTNETTVCNADGQLLCRDRTSVSGQEFVKRALGIMGAKATAGTFYYLRMSADPERLCDLLGQVAHPTENLYVGISALPNNAGVWARIIASEVSDLRQAITRLWEAAREDVTGGKPSKRKK